MSQMVECLLTMDIDTQRFSSSVHVAVPYLSLSLHQRGGALTAHHEGPADSHPLPAHGRTYDLAAPQYMVSTILIMYASDFTCS